MRFNFQIFVLFILFFFLFPNFSKQILSNPIPQVNTKESICEEKLNNLLESFENGKNLFSKGKYSEAHRCFQIFVQNINNNQDNMQNRKHIREAYIYKGAIETLLGDFPSSIKSYQDALTAIYSPPINNKEIESIDTKKELAMIYNNIYISAAHDKQEKLASEYKKKHDKIRSLEKEKGATNKLYADDSFERGSIYFGDGIFNLEKGLKLRQSPDKEKEMVETLEKAVLALEYAEKEYSKSEESVAKNVMLITTLLNDSAGLEVSGKPEEAQKKFKLAIDKRETSKVEDKYLERTSQTLLKLVEIKREMNKITPGKYKEEEIQKQSNYARKIQEFIYPDQKDCNNLPKRTWNLQLANYYLGEANDLFNKNRFDDSLVKADCAEKYLQLPEKEDIYYNQYSEGRQFLIKIFTVQKNFYKKKNLQKDKLRKLNRILDLIREYYLYSYSIGSDKEDEIKREKYRDFFEETFLSYTRKKEDIKDAFIVSEKFRSISISDFINLDKSLSVPKINSEDKKKLIKLKKEMNQTAAQSMAFRFLDLDLVDISQKNNSLTSEFEKLDIKLKKENQEYKKLRYSSDLNFKVDDLISSLSAANKVMLHFFFTDVEKNSGNLHVTILGSKTKACSGICSYYYKDIIESELSKKILFYKLLLSINPREIKGVAENLLVMVDKGNISVHSDKEEEVKTFIGSLEKSKTEKKLDHPCPVKNEKFNKCEIYIIPKDKYPIWIKELSQELHTQLISPLYQNKYIQPTSEKEIGEQLVIAPDKSLYFLPFSALIDENGKYFLESHAHSYTLSADVWYYNHKRYIGTEHTTLEGLIVGAFQDFETLPNYCQNESLKGPIKFMTCVLSEYLSVHGEEMDLIKKTFNSVKKEIIDIQKNIPSKFLDNAVYTLKGNLATKENLQDILTLSESRYVRYLHIVGHGVSNSLRPGLNSILLSPESLEPNQADEKKEIENSLSRFLTEADVMGMNFSSELVTLSSCSSATGFESDAEGNIGLPRAFIMSGARNVLGPLWNVSSTKTKEIMGKFYQTVNKLRAEEKLGERKSENEALILQNTLNEFRKREDLHNHPYYWAAFVIYGE